MCTYAMESVMDPCNTIDIQELDDIDWLNKYVETENVFLDYFKSLTYSSFNNDPVENILSEYDGTESGFDALNNLLDLLVSLCDGDLAELEFTDGNYGIQTPDTTKKKQESRSKRSLKSLSSHYGKELQVKPNRARSHSSVDVDEILRNQDLVEINSSESRRKSRRVSLGMRPRFSNWSKVKGAFKRDKSNSRLDSRDGDDRDYSGDEGPEKIDSQFSSSHENIGQISSSEEEFDYYIDGFSLEKDLIYQPEEENLLKIDVTEIRHSTSGNLIPKSKSAILQSQNSKSRNSANVNSSLHKNPFKWYRTKSITPVGDGNVVQDSLSTPPSPYKNSEFLFDDESIKRMNNDQIGNTVNEQNTNPNEIFQEVQNKYESLQKRLSREFYERYHDKKRNRESSTNDDEEKFTIDLNDPKLSSYLGEQNLSPAFKQKFQEWQKLKGLSSSSPKNKTKNENINTLKKSKSDWHKWRPGSKSESNVLKFFDKDVPQREMGVNFDGELEEGGTYLPVRCKKQRIDIFKGKNNNPLEKKELAWLEKELQKVAREKQRLEKEKEKYAERETRLRNMKRAIKSGRKQKQEVLVPTSTGLFRFQGISSKFTRKLYEWEKAKGITAESSTFALLDSYYGGSDKSRNNKIQNSDVMALLSRSRSVGSVEVAGTGNSLLQSGLLNHQQSSLSLNDMEQLEEVHLQVENDSLMRNTAQLFEKENIDELDLISSESLIIPDYHKNNLSHSIPISSSIKSLQDQDSDLNNHNQVNYNCEDRKSEKSIECYDSGSEISFHPFQTDINFEVLSNKERKNSANADAVNIVNQIKKLRAGTSIDDKDRINVLTNLQHLADQLLEMVHNMNNKKNENCEDLAVKIADLAVALKKEIKILTSEELQANYEINEKLSVNNQNARCENFENDFRFCREDIYSDTEDNDSPTVHCTFTLPSWRVKYTTPSSTESESSNTRNKYVDIRHSKSDRQRKHFKEDNSSGCDENYDGSDETTLYLDLRSIKNQERRESSDNISTSNSESIVSSEAKEKFIKNYRISPEYIENVDENIVHCSLKLNRQNKIKEEYCKEKIKNFNIDDEKNDISFTDSTVDEAENNLNVECESEDQPLKMEIRSYSPKPIISKRKCNFCGKIKRVSKSRKMISNNYCPCGKKDSEQCTLNKKEDEVIKNSSKKVEDEYDIEESNDRKISKIFRSKIYDFKSLQNSEKSNTDSDNVSVNVIVPTTRKIFTPLKQDKNGGASAVVSFTVDENENASKCNEDNAKRENLVIHPWENDMRSNSISPSTSKKSLNCKTNHPYENKKSILELHANVDKLPPASPLSYKRATNKDNNSSIKMMIAHYNKLMSEKPAKKTGEGNCWTPTLQKSPVLERRSHFELLKSNSETNNIRKSRSAILSTKNQKLTTKSETPTNENLQFGISKSSSTGSIQYRVSVYESENTENVNVKKRNERNTTLENNYTNDTKVSSLDLISADENYCAPSNPIISYVIPLERNTSFENVLSEVKLRNLKLQEAKNKFFNEYPNRTVEQLFKKAESQQKLDEIDMDLDSEDKMQFNGERCSNIENETNFNLTLNKSVSTGAIDDRTKMCNLVSNVKSSNKNKFGFSSIASKFRKVKMRRHKDPEISAVSSLCRASLFVDLNKESKQKEYLNSSKSCPSSPVMQRTVSKRNSSTN